MFDKCNIRTIQLKDGQIFSGCVRDFREQEDHTIIYQPGFFVKEYIHVGGIASDHVEFSFSKLLDHFLFVVMILSLLTFAASIAVLFASL
jgi:hypothetical protein